MRKSRGLNSSAWRLLRMKTLHRDGFRCRHCGKAGKLEVDHILPIWKGGTDREENLQTLCRADHLRKTRRENAKPMTPAEKRWARLVDHLAAVVE